jgi:hypothetical protein
VWRATPPEHSSAKSFALIGIGDRIRRNAEPFLAEVDAPLTLVSNWRPCATIPPAMPHEVLQRDDWNGSDSIKIRDVFQLQKDQKRVVCELWRHPFGWELRLEAAGEMLQTQVCRSQKEWIETFEAWKPAMLKKGWQ